MLNFGAGQWVWMCRMRYKVTRGRTYIFCWLHLQTAQPYHTKWCFPHILSPHHRLKILYRFKFLRWEQVFSSVEWITMLSASSQRLEPNQWRTLITLNDRGSLTITVLLSAFLWLLSITAINASLKSKVVYVYLLYSVICTKKTSDLTQTAVYFNFIKSSAIFRPYLYIQLEGMKICTAFVH